jgi:hypothetical protein
MALPSAPSMPPENPNVIHYIERTESLTDRGFFDQSFTGLKLSDFNPFNHWQACEESVYRGDKLSKPQYITDGTRRYSNVLPKWVKRILFLGFATIVVPCHEILLVVSCVVYRIVKSLVFYHFWAHKTRKFKTVDIIIITEDKTPALTLSQHVKEREFDDNVRGLETDIRQTSHDLETLPEQTAITTTTTIKQKLSRAIETEEEFDARNSFQGRLADFGKDLLRIVASPLCLVGLELSAIYGVFSPFNGQKLFSTFERTIYGNEIIGCLEMASQPENLREENARDLYGRFPIPISLAQKL